MPAIGDLRKASVFREGSRRLVGKIRCAVFHPTEPRLVGFIVRCADIAGMKRRRDHFLSFDSMACVDGVVIASKDRAAWDGSACERLGIDYDACLVWETMPAVAESGESLGRVEDVEYDPLTGEVLSITTTEGAAFRFLVGDVGHRADSLIGYSSGALVFREAAAWDPASGGAAAMAGEATARAMSAAREKMEPVSRGVLDSFQKGAYRFGELLGRARDHLVDDDGDGDGRSSGTQPSSTSAEDGRGAEAGVSGREAVFDDGSSPGDRLGYGLGRRLGGAKGMFSAFKEEYVKARDRDD